jgi:acylphosphatase
MDEQTGRHFFISGRVQGVFFRANTQREATRLGVTGWVRNLSDGRVEVLAYGTDAQVQALADWLAVGPRGAKVTDIVSDAAPWEEHVDFAVT